MKKLCLLILIVPVFICLFKKADAQTYQTAAGLRFSYESGVSIKYFTAPTIALEGVLGFREKGAVVTGLYEINQVAFNVAELKFYYGFGAHIGGVGRGDYKVYNGDYQVYANPSLLFGVDAVVGLEYVIPSSPIAVSVDLDPRIEVVRGPLFNLAPSIGVKYAF